MSLENLQKRKPVTDINSYTFTFYGSVGQGKSSLANALFDDVLFFAWEQGQNALEAYVQDMYSWKDVLAFIKEAKKIKKDGGTFPFKCVVIDTADIMRDECEKYVCRVNGWDSPSDADFGAGWSIVRREFEDRIREIESLGLKVHYIAHDKVQKIERKDMTYEKITLLLGSTAVNQVIKKVDFILYFDKEFEKDKDGNVFARRVIRFNGGENYEAKARVTGFPDFIYAGNSAEETAQIIKDLFKEKSQALLNGTTEETTTKTTKEPIKEEKEPLREEKDDQVTQEEIDELTKVATQKLREKKAKPEDITNIIKANSSVELMKDLRDRKEFEKVKREIGSL